MTVRTAWRIVDVPGGARAVKPDARGTSLDAAVLALAGFSGRIVVELGGMVPEDCAPAETAEEASARAAAAGRLAALPGFTIALIDGVASGLGVMLALACRARVATPDGAFALGEVGVGLIPPGDVLWQLRDLCGMGEAIGLIVRAGRVDALRASSSGLIDALAPAQVARATAAALAPPSRARRAQLYRSRLGKWVVKRQALGELAARAAPHAAVKAVTLLFEHDLPAPEAVAAAIGELAESPERRYLQRIERARSALLGGPRALPRRALVLAQEGAWQWVCALAQRGVKVRWCSRDPRAFGDGLCWIARDTERFQPERRELTLEAVTVSETRAGFAGRDLVVVDAATRLTAAERALLAENAVVLFDRGTRVLEPRGEEDVEVALPHDALTSHVCVVHGHHERAEAFMRGLGFMLLSGSDAQIAYKALESFDARWRQLREGGATDKQILASLQSFGFATRDVARRLRFHAQPGRAGPQRAYEIVCAMWKSMQEVDAATAERIDLALIMETGFPAHRGGPLGLLEQVKARPGVLHELGLGDGATV